MGNPLHHTRQHPTAPHPLAIVPDQQGGKPAIPIPSATTNHLRLRASTRRLQAALRSGLSPPTSCGSTVHTPGSRRLSSKNYHRQPAAAPTTTHRLQVALHSSRAINTSSRFAYLSHPGGFPFSLASGGDLLPLFPAPLFTSLGGRHRTQKQAVVQPFTPHTKQREREKSQEKTKSIHKHTNISTLTIHTSSIPIQQSPISGFTWVNRLNRPRWPGPW